MLLILLASLSLMSGVAALLPRSIENHLVGENNQNRTLQSLILSEDTPHSFALGTCINDLFDPNAYVDYQIQINGLYWQAQGDDDNALKLTTDKNSDATTWRFVPHVPGPGWHIVNVHYDALITVGSTYMDLVVSKTGEAAVFTAECDAGKSTIKYQMKDNSDFVPYCRNAKCNLNRVCYKNNGGCNCNEANICTAGSPIWLTNFEYEERHQCKRNPPHCDDWLGVDWYEIKSSKCGGIKRRRVCGRTKNPDGIVTTGYTAQTWHVEPVELKIPLDVNHKIGSNARSLKNLDKKNFARVVEFNYHFMRTHLSAAQQAEAQFDKVVNDAWSFLNSGFTPIAAHSKELDALPQHRPKFLLESDVTLQSSELLDACTTSIIDVLISIIILVFSVAGLPQTHAENAARSLIREMGFETINRFRSSFEFILRETGGTVTRGKQALEVLSIFGGVYNAVGLRAIYTALYDTLDWYDYITVGLVAVSQFVVWFGTDGAATYAELVLLSNSIAQIVTIAADIEKACGN